MRGVFWNFSHERRYGKNFCKMGVIGNQACFSVLIQYFVRLPIPFLDKNHRQPRQPNLRK